MAQNKRPTTEDHISASAKDDGLSKLMELLSTLSLDSPLSQNDNANKIRYSHLDEINPFEYSEVSAEYLVSIWMEILDKKTIFGVTDLLFLEFWISIGQPAITRKLRERSKNFTYTNTLIAVRKRVAYSLYDYARDLNWQQPVTYVSALKAARAYLRDACGHSEAPNWKDYGQFTGKLGVATVLIAGFEDVSVDDAMEAYDAIRCSLDVGNDPVSALPYLVDAATLSFDFTGDVSKLQRAINFAQGYGTISSSPALILSLAQAKLRIALQLMDKQALNDVASLADKAEQDYDEKVTEFLQIRILHGIIRHLQKNWKSGTSASAMRLPFGYRTGDKIHPLLLASAREVFAEIFGSEREQDAMVAGVLADLVVNCRSCLGITEEEALVAAIKYRRAGGSDSRSKLVRFHDELKLAGLRRDHSGRSNAIRELQELAQDPRFTAAALMVLADSTETWESHLTEIGDRPTTEKRDVPEPGTVENPTYETATRLWNRAATSALENANLTRVNLGGRSSATTVGDYYGLVSETLVYKRMDKRSWERGNRRAVAIKQYLDDNGWNQEFAVSTVLATKEVGDAIIVAHRFVSGLPLMRIFEHVNNERHLELAILAARFLGLINRSEKTQASEVGVRKELKVKEVGRFLKSCGIQNYLEPFDRWWSIVGNVDKVTRRDSHLDNWIIDESGKIVAIDWDATGCRPFGYDLAQITDDHAYFDVTDWASRRKIFDAYLEQVQPASNLESCWRSYKASVLARHLWAITSPERAKQFHPGEAERRLQAYIQTVGDKELSQIAEQALTALLNKRGLNGLPPASKHTTGAGRIRLSRQIAFHLRHSESLERDPAGWVRIASLVKELPYATHEEIASIATDPRETRFDVQGEVIRARYGHNARIGHNSNLDQELSGTVTLYHASPWKFAFEILDNESGLEPKSRTMVHLTDSLSEAVASGIRQGHPLIYETRSSSLSCVTKAGTRTYLTPAVDHSALMVLPVSAYWKELPAISKMR